VQLEQLESLAILDQQVLLDLLGLMVKTVPQVLLDLQEPQELLVEQVQQEQLVLQEQVELEL
jgi:hypothetical protein